MISSGNMTINILKVKKDVILVHINTKNKVQGFYFVFRKTRCIHTLDLNTRFSVIY